MKPMSRWAIPVLLFALALAALPIEVSAHWTPTCCSLMSNGCCAILPNPTPVPTPGGGGGGGRGGGGGGGGGGGQPTPAPTPAPTACPSGSGRDGSTMDAFRQYPAHPVVVGQGGDGFYVEAQFGKGKTWWLDCGGRHESPDRITRIDVEVSLADSSVAWIRGELRQRYPGADVKGSYPVRATLYAGSPSDSVSVRWPASGYFRAPDPGYYVLTFEVRTESGATDRFERRVGVYLIDSSLIR